MKKSLFSFYTVSLMLVLSIFLIGCSSGEGNKNANSEKETDANEVESIKLKLSNYYAATAPFSEKAIEPWMERVTELTEGKVEFDYFPGGQLGGGNEQFELVRDGVADIGFTNATYEQDYWPLTSMLSSIPILNNNATNGSKAFLDLIQEEESLIVENDFLNNGVRPLFGAVSPPVEIFTADKEIRVPSDMEGVLIRTAGGVESEALNYMGAVPTTISFGDVYESLERGIIDATTVHTVALRTAGADQLIDYRLGVSLSNFILPLFINENTWQSLPDNVKEAMLQASEEIAIAQAESQDADTIEVEELFEAEGMITPELEEDEIQQWEEFAEEFRLHWLSNNSNAEIPYEDTLNLYINKLN